MAINITTTNIECNFVKVLVYADSGVGKTTLIKTAPNPIIISTESGLLPLSGLNIPVIKVTTYDDLIEAFQYVTDITNMDSFDTICLDSITDLAESILTSYKKDHKDPRQAYGKLNDDIAEIIRAFRDIDTHHVYFTAKMNRVEDSNSGMARYGAMMPGRTLSQQVPYFFDEVLCLQMAEDEDGVKYRYLQTQPSVTHTAKDRSGKLNDPEEPDLTKIFNKIVTQKEVSNHKPQSKKEQ
jgi:phage nucleotide-binding protein